MTGSDGRSAGALPREARRGGHAGARRRRASAPEAEPSAALRRPGAPRARGCTGTCGSSTTACSRPGRCRAASRPTRAQPPRRAHRGPPARVPRVPRRDPGRPVRRRHDEDLGQRHLRGAQVPRRRGDGHVPRRAGARPLRAVPHQGRRLDDPPDGPAGGSRTASRCRSGSRRCSPAPGRCPPEDGGWAYEIKWDGVRAIAFVAGRPADARSARTGRDITPRYPELRPLGAALAGREVVLDGEVVAFDGARPSFQKLQGRMHLTSEHAVRRLAQSRPRPLHRLRPALPRRPLADGAALRRAARAARRAGARRARPGRRPPTTSATAPRCSRLTRAQQLEGIDRQAAGLPVHAGPPLLRLGEGEEHLLHRRRRSAAGCRARAAAAGGSARWCSASPTTTACCATPAASAPASPRPSSRGSAALLEPLARDDSPFTGTPAAEAHALRRAAARRARRLHRAHPRRHAAPAVLQGPARRRGARGRAASGRSGRHDHDPTRRRAASPRGRPRSASARCRSRSRAAPTRTQAIRTIHAALDAGVDLIDTADAYASTSTTSATTSA